MYVIGSEDEMGLFDFLKNDDTKRNAPKMQKRPLYADSSSIDEDERQYYQTDEYYLYVVHPGTPFEKKVVPFDERKAISYPSKSGLYVAEILLLEYCTYGSYPKPKNGYPGFWWFDYGIRDIGHALSSLYDRGYIQLSISKKALNAMPVAELRRIASENNLSVDGKKKDVIDTLMAHSYLEGISSLPNIRKYELTEKGETELAENAYVPYMHKHPHKTIEDSRFGTSFTVWDINKLLHNKDITKWREIVGSVELKQFGVNVACEEANVDKSIPISEQFQCSSEEMKQYIIDCKEKIRIASQSPGDGYEEESKGLDYARLGKDREALYWFYVSICKGFDAPALYNETMKLLKKYNLPQEELSVAKVALKAIPDSNRSKDRIAKRIEELEGELSC